MGAACNKRKQNAEPGIDSESGEAPVEEEPEPSSGAECKSVCVALDEPEDLLLSLKRSQLNLKRPAKSAAAVDSKATAVSPVVKEDPAPRKPQSPAMVQAEIIKEFTVTVTRGEGTSLGAQCEDRETCLVIRSVMSDGLLSAWNQANPDNAIQDFDSIVDVNGINGKSDAMVAELKNLKEHQISIQRLKLLPHSSASSSSSSRTVPAPAWLRAPMALQRPSYTAGAAARRPNSGTSSPQGDVCLNLDAREECPKIEVDVILDKTGGTTLGVAAKPEPQNGSLIIDNIGEEGLVASWNKEHPDCPIKEGDRIIDINGAHGSTDRLVAQCKENKVLNIKLLRDVVQGEAGGIPPAAGLAPTDEPVAVAQDTNEPQGEV